MKLKKAVLRTFVPFFVPYERQIELPSSENRCVAGSRTKIGKDEQLANRRHKGYNMLAPWCGSQGLWATATKEHPQKANFPRLPVLTGTCEAGDMPFTV
eukprot:2536831-Amphidinium_carterae.1